jgi:hypothetical protein
VAQNTVVGQENTWRRKKHDRGPEKHTTKKDHTAESCQRWSIDFLVPANYMPTDVDSKLYHVHKHGNVIQFF